MLETVLEQFIIRQREAVKKKEVKEQKVKGVYSESEKKGGRQNPRENARQ
jgi:hypothetical protein